MARKTPVHPSGAPTPGGPYSPAIIAGGFLFVSGQTPRKPGTRDLVEGDIRVQTRQTLDNVRVILEAVGCTMADVVKVSAHLADIREFAAFNEVYGEYFSEPYPARTTVESKMSGGAPLMIDVIALQPQKGDEV